MSNLALIPARGGSERVKHKNIRNFCGKPLIAYTIAAAKESGCFDRILVSSDDTTTLDIAAGYGVDCVRRPEEFATATSSDIEWVTHALAAQAKSGPKVDNFSILRPTSPFRSARSIQVGVGIWDSWNRQYTSLRAMQPVAQHPGKMWKIVGLNAYPLIMQPEGQPYHDSQYKSLPLVHVQNAAFEIASIGTPEIFGTISGDTVFPYEMEGLEGFDINTELDWEFGEWLVETGKVELPDV